jgi:hypothetical protein
MFAEDYHMQDAILGRRVTVRIKTVMGDGRRWLTPIILATQEAEIRRITVRSQSGQIVLQDPLLKKPITKNGLVKWLKVKALSLSLSTAKKKKKSQD